jgi:hypothetical protein
MGTTEKTVRFSKLVEEFGKPALYLALADPAKDPKFQQAVEEQRVLTIKQDPTSKQKDFGVIGLMPEKFVTYLIFPKSLERFANARVVGVKYEELAEDAVAPPASAIEIKPKKSANPPKTEAKPEPKPKIKPEPQPRSFTVRVQVSSSSCTEQDISVTAFTKAEAEAKAKEEAFTLKLPEPDLRTKILKIREAS